MKFLIKAFAISLIILNPGLAQVTGLEGWDIVLDPGHSRTENMGIYNHSEAERNLRVAWALRDYLLNTTDIDTVYLTRTNDQQIVSLSQRTDYANRIGASWYHSIHSDAEPPPRNSTLLLWGQHYNGQEKNPPGGQALSDIMVDLLTRGMRIDTRGSIGDCSFYTWSDFCKNSGGPYLHVNRTTTMPSELSEAGSHTNPTQNQRFMNAEFKKMEAKTFYWSILKLHGIERPYVGTCMGIIRDEETGVPVNGAIVKLDGQTYITDTYESLFHKYSNDANQLHNGFYFLEDLAHDTLTMTVDAKGYRSDTLQVAIVDTFFTFADVELVPNAAPYVIATTPIEGDTTVRPDDYLIFDFSRRMDKTSVEDNFSIAPYTTGKFFWTNENAKMLFKPDSLSYLTEYTVTIGSGAKDLYEHFFDGNGDGTPGDPFELHFRTGPRDITAPEIVSIFPPQNGSDIDLQPIIRIQYDEELDASSINPDELVTLERFKDRTAVPGILEHYVVNDTSILCYFPAEKLFFDEVYITRIASGLRDITGNETDQFAAYSFSTAEYDYAITTIDNFDSNAEANWWAPQQSGSTTGILTEQTGRKAIGSRVNHITNSSTAIELSYGWDVNAPSHLIRLYAGGSAPRGVTFNSEYMMQLYVFGDGSGNLIRFCVDDKYPVAAASNHEVSPWIALDWIGWKLISWDMSPGETGTWLGDGTLDGTLRFDSIQLTYNPDSPISGTIYLDDLRVVKKKYVDVADKNDIPLPATTDLRQNYPNPFNPQTTIQYDLPAGSHHVRLVIYDMLGKQVRTLVDGNQSGGSHSILWNGRDDNGQQVASGIYVYKLSAGKQSYTKQMTLVR
ncbi:T9SS type A sorting domain-containing protein [candidate division KSB1 bacterium]|nr:T9SS type A sorting domain-containing protein [candidate division KSB1 bacterium]